MVEEGVVVIVPDFESTAFVDGARVEGLWDEVWTNTVREVGQIRFPSGRVLVADALATDFEGHPAFEIQVPEGPHPVFTSLATFPNDDRRITAAWVKFGDGEVHHWHPAYYEGHDPDDNYDPGFGVDSGTACIADAESAAQHADEESGERLLKLLLDNQKITWDAEFHPDAPETFFACSSGIGDGFYTSFWGTDSDQNPVYLVVDFDMLCLPVVDEVDFDLPLGRGRLQHELIEKYGSEVRVRKPLFGAARLETGRPYPRVRFIVNGEARAVAPKWRLGQATFDIPKDAEQLRLGFVASYRSATAVR